jgi:hypothetical protein
MDASVLAELQRWYYSQSDGDWEHCYGIKIETLDHPGWHVTIDLQETELEDATFAEVQHNEMGHRYEDNPDWFVCRKVGSKFEGFGGPEQLEAMLCVFLTWYRSQPDQPAV